MEATVLCRRITDLYAGSAKEMFQIDDPDNPGKTIPLPTVYMPIDGKTLIIEDDPQSVYQLPPVILDHFDQLRSVHLGASVYDNTNIRIDSWGTDGSVFHIHTGRTTYFHSLVTNRAMDRIFGEGLTVRGLLEPGPVIHTLETSRLSNHLGINGFIESADHAFCFVFRKKTVSIGRQRWACCVSGSLKTKHALDNGRVTAGSLLRGIVSEIRDELDLPPDALVSSAEGQPIELVCAYRDLIEGGKPHLFFYGKCILKKAEIDRAFHEKARMISVAPGRDPGVEMSMDGYRLFWIYRNALEDPERFRLYPDHFSVGQNDYFIDPSYTACIQMLRNYLIKRHP